ncbi:hypothetical protein C8R46DRAFT_1227647 [Mycena filopes]|nr:hypothetical protein C8R46DRAFT_1227647 [Mycena filopes]
MSAEEVSTQEFASQKHYSDRFWAAFEQQKNSILAPDQTLEGLQASFKALQINTWAEHTVGQSPLTMHVLRWCLQSTTILLAPWSVVKLKIVPLSEAGRQFGLSATQDIPCEEPIYKAVGLLSSDKATDAPTTRLSEMRAWDGTDFFFLDNKSDLTIVLKTNRDISAGEDLTVNYGDDYFEGGCVCDKCATPKVITAPKSRIINRALKREAQQRKRLAKRQNARQMAGAEMTVEDPCGRKQREKEGYQGEEK